MLFAITMTLIILYFCTGLIRNIIELTKFFKEKKEVNKESNKKLVE